MEPALPSVIPVAVVQEPPVFLNLPASMEVALRCIAEAAARGARVIAFPETWLPGYPVWLDYAPQAAVWDHPPARELYRLLCANALTVGGEAFRRLAAAAADSGACIVMGAHEAAGHTLYNSLVLFHPNGRDFVLHRKLVPTYGERLIWGRGDGSTLGVLSTPLGVVGGLICWEHWMPLLRAHMHAHLELLHIAQWPAVRDLHQIASRHYAFEGQCFVLAAGTALRKRDTLAGLQSLPGVSAGARELLASMPQADDDFLHRGGSAVIAPDGNYILEPVWERGGVFTAELDTRLAQESRMFIDTVGHYSRPDIFTLQVDTRPQPGVVRLGEPAGRLVTQEES